MYRYTIADTRRLTPNVALLTLHPKRPKDRLRFYAGQYAAIGFRRHGRPSPMRCFSIVSAPNVAGELQFAVRTLGAFTHALGNLQPGDNVLVRGPFGNFVVDEHYDQSVVLVAGGIGITPCMSIIRAHDAQRSAKPLALLYSCSSQDNIPFYDELQALVQRDPHLTVTYFVTNGPTSRLASAATISTRIGSEHLAQLANDRSKATTFFVCGPKSFIGTHRKTLLANGTPAERIITEEFTPSKADEVLQEQPGWNVQRWTYGLTAAAIAAATVSVMSLDLARAVPRLTSASSHATTLPQSPAASSSSSNIAAPTNAASQPAATPTQASYQQPVTSVS